MSCPKRCPRSITASDEDADCFAAGAEQQWCEDCNRWCHCEHCQCDGFHK